MSLYKRNGIWSVSLIKADGTRIRKSTGLKDETKARIIERSLAALVQGNLTRKKVLAILNEILPEEEQGLSLKDACSYYESTASMDGDVPCAKEFRRRICVLDAMLKWAADNTRAQFISDIDNETAWNYTQYFSSTRNNITAKSVNGVVGHLRTAWKTYMKHGKAQGNPWTNARVKRRPEEEKHGRAFTDEEVDRILDASRKIGCEWYEVTMFGLYTGLRLGDIVSLEWSEIDLGAKLIMREPNKTKRVNIRVRMPLHPRLVEILKEISRTSNWVFPWRQSHPSGRRVKPDDHFFRDVIAEAGITDDVTFHCTRHTFITRLAERGVAQDVRMRLAGHTVQKTSDIYTHDDEMARKAIESI